MPQFRELVARALDELPHEFGRLLDNVEIIVEDEPPVEIARRFRGVLLGLYEGVPLDRRGFGATIMPDRIRLFRRNLLACCRTPGQLEDQVRRTVLHEIGHHFGLEEADLRRAGY